MLQCDLRRQMMVVTSSNRLKRFPVFVFTCSGYKVEGVEAPGEKPAGPECHLKVSKVYFFVTEKLTSHFFFF